MFWRGGLVRARPIVVNIGVGFERVMQIFEE